MARVRHVFPNIAVKRTCRTLALACMLRPFAAGHLTQVLDDQIKSPNVNDIAVGYVAYLSTREESLKWASDAALDFSFNERWEELWQTFKVTFDLLSAERNGNNSVNRIPVS